MWPVPRTGGKLGENIAVKFATRVASIEARSANRAVTIAAMFAADKTAGMQDVNTAARFAGRDEIIAATFENHAAIIATTFVKAVTTAASAVVGPSVGGTPGVEEITGIQRDITTATAANTADTRSNGAAGRVKKNKREITL